MIENSPSQALGKCVQLEIRFPDVFGFPGIRDFSSSDDVVAIKRTQFGPGLKMHRNYKVVQPNDRYDVERLGIHEGPKRPRLAPTI